MPESSQLTIRDHSHPHQLTPTPSSMSNIKPEPIDSLPSSPSSSRPPSNPRKYKRPRLSGSSSSFSPSQPPSGHIPTTSLTNLSPPQPPLVPPQAAPLVSPIVLGFDHSKITDPVAKLQVDKALSLKAQQEELIKSRNAEKGKKFENVGLGGNKRGKRKRVSRDFDDEEEDGKDYELGGEDEPTSPPVTAPTPSVPPPSSSQTQPQPTKPQPTTIRSNLKAPASLSMSSRRSQKGKEKISKLQISTSAATTSSSNPTFLSQSQDRSLLLQGIKSAPATKVVFSGGGDIGREENEGVAGGTKTILGHREEGGMPMIAKGNREKDRIGNVGMITIPRPPITAYHPMPPLTQSFQHQHYLQHQQAQAQQHVYHQQAHHQLSHTHHAQSISQPHLHTSIPTLPPLTGSISPATMSKQAFMSSMSSLYDLLTSNSQMEEMKKELEEMMEKKVERVVREMTRDLQFLEKRLERVERGEMGGGKMNED